MAERDFTYSTTRELPCGCDCGACSRCTCGTASREVIICLEPEIAPPFITEDDDEIAFDFITAEIVSCCRQERACPPIYSYVLRYDDDDILVDELLPQHVTGIVCKSCEFNYFSALIATGSGVFTLSVTDTTSIDLTLAADNLQASVIIYDAVLASNMLTIDPDGLLVRPLAVADTTSINLTVAGTPPAQQTVSGVVILYDAVANSNMLTIDADGLLVRPLTVTDSTSINFTLAGIPPAAQNVTGVVIISPNVGNILTNPGNGLFVGSVNPTILDSPSINLFYSGSDLSASAIISPQGGNLLAIIGDGLYASFSADDTCTIDLDLTGGTLTANAIISTLPDNQLQAVCGGPDDGLYVPPITSIEWDNIIGYPADNEDLTDYILELVPCWQNSIVLDGGSGCLELDGDQLAPGTDLYYGTDSGGVKGFHPFTTFVVDTELPIEGDGTFGDPISLLISTDVGNNATLGTDNGLFVPTGTATVSSSFPIIGDGSGGNPVDLLLSSDVGNQATIGTDNGLFVPTGTVTVTTAFPIIGDGSGGNPVDLLLSSDVGNQATIGTDNGLFVPATSIVATDFPIIGDGSGGNPVAFLISADVGNIATLGTDSGLFVPDVPATVEVTLPVTGDGSIATPLDILLSADVGNNIVLGTDSGLYVPTGTATVSVTLPITGDGSGGSPLDILLSADVGNSLSLGTDSGLFRPADPTPGPLVITRTASESGNNGNGISFGLRRQALAAAGTTESTYLMQVPDSWNGTDVELLARLSIDNAGDGGVRFQWGIAAFAAGETLDAVDDQTISFTQSMLAEAADDLVITTSQLITAANLAVGDFLRITLRRLGGDGADTQSGSLNLFQVSAQFNRTANFGVTA